MTARAVLLHDHDTGWQFARWSLAGATVVAAHAGLVASYFLLKPPPPPGAPAAPVMIIELAPVPVAPMSLADLAPGPEMQEAPPPPAPLVEAPPPAPLVADLPPTPPMLEPPVVAAPIPPPPEIEPEPKTEVEPQPKPPEAPPPEVKPVERRKPAPRTTAAPRSKQKAAARPAAPATGAVASPSAVADWRSQVVSKLQRAKRYPGGAERRGEQGVVTLAFSINRSGGVQSRRIVRSSGNSELDQEALAMVQRASPFPPFPTGMPQSSVHLSVPVRFSLR